MKLSFSLLLSILVTATSAQVEEQDSVATKPKKPDSLREKIYLRAIRVGTDLITLGKAIAQKDYSGWELNTDFDIGKVYVAVDYGDWGRTYALHDGGTYENQGKYWRAGLDINLLKKDPDRNMFFFGFRYGSSNFNESATIISVDPNFGTIRTAVSNQNVHANWGEITTGLRVNVWGSFWMGYTARLKFAPSVKGGSELQTYDIPGFGVNGNSVYWGFNYQVFWKIPLSKSKGTKKDATESVVPK